MKEHCLIIKTHGIRWTHRYKVDDQTNLARVEIAKSHIKANYLSELYDRYQWLNKNICSQYDDLSTFNGKDPYSLESFNSKFLWKNQPQVSELWEMSPVILTQEYEVDTSYELKYCFEVEFQCEIKFDNPHDLMLFSIMFPSLKLRRPDL